MIDAIVSAIIAFAVLLLTCLLAMFGAGSGGYSGGCSEHRGGRSEHRGSSTTVNQFTDFQTKFLPRPIAADYTRLFIDAYNDTDAPPVITLDDIKHELPYHATKMFMPTTHIGQRKLFLCELQFLVDKAPADQPIVCVYAGAAPSHHTGYLASLFPRVKFILVDPNPFDVFEATPVVLSGDDNSMMQTAMAGDAQIYIINDLMTMELAAAVRDHVPHEQLYFISDIRTNTNDDNFGPTTLDVLWNLSQQYNWMSIMRPRWSIVKFRHPFYADNALTDKHTQHPYAADFEQSAQFGIDFVANHAAKTLTYWDGEINLQAFPGSTSTETRLITDGSKLRSWGTSDDYEGKLFYYNTIERGFRHHANDNACREAGFDHCNDCAIENYLWKKYIVWGADGSTTTPSVIDYVRKLSVITYRELLREDHGRLFGPRYPLDNGRIQALRSKKVHHRTSMPGVVLK